MRKMAWRDLRLDGYPSTAVTGSKHFEAESIRKQGTVGCANAIYHTLRVRLAKKEERASILHTCTCTADTCTEASSMRKRNAEKTGK